MPQKLEPVGVHAARVLDQPGDRQRGQGLAGPGLADEPDGLATADGEGDTADRADRAARPREGDRQVADVEHQASPSVARRLTADVGASVRRRWSWAAVTVRRRRCRTPKPPGDGLAEEVEGQPGEDDDRCRARAPRAGST